MSGLSANKKRQVRTSALRTSASRIPRTHPRSSRPALSLGASSLFPRANAHNCVSPQASAPKVGTARVVRGRKSRAISARGERGQRKQLRKRPHGLPPPSSNPILDQKFDMTRARGPHVRTACHLRVLHRRLSVVLPFKRTCCRRENCAGAYAHLRVASRCRRCPNTPRRYLCCHLIALALESVAACLYAAGHLRCVNVHRERFTPGCCPGLIRLPLMFCFLGPI